MPLRLLYQDEHLVAVDKPAGFQVHPPDDPVHRVRPSRNCLVVVREQLGRYVYPVHRLDSATAGVLLFALTPEAAKGLAAQFRERLVRKTYVCVARGWLHEDEILLERPLASRKVPGQTLPSSTRLRSLARLELPHAVGRYATARYSLLYAEPLTGRLHQIRRHLAGDSHPLIGDSVYGDGEHNRFFREELKLPSLLLKAQALRFRHPVSGEEIRIESRWTGRWHRVFELFGVCPCGY